MKNEPFSLLVNGQHEIKALPEDAQLLDVISEGPQGAHVLKGGIAYHADLVEINHLTRTYVFQIGGNKYEVKIEDHYDRLVKKLGLHTGGGHKLNTLKAPMPGMVLDVMVKPGQDVQKGDPLLILEAMKMENVLKATGEGRVKAVNVEKGAAVNKGQLLLEME